MAIETGPLTFSILFIYSFACLSFGILIYHALIGMRNPRPDIFINKNEAVLLATAFLLGQGTLATVWILLSLGGWFYPVVVKAVVGVACISGIPCLIGHVRGFWVQVRNIYRETRADTWGWQFIALMGIVFSIAGVSSLGAPLLEDGANFYMIQPKIVAETYRYQLIPFKNAYYGGGFQGEMNYAALMSLGSADAARLYSWITLLAGTTLLIGLCKRAGLGRRGQWMALAMIMTSSMINTILGKGKVDLFQMAMGMGAYYWMTDNSRPGRRMSGLLAGFAVLGKVVYAFPILPGMLVLLIWQELQERVGERNIWNFLKSYIRKGLELAMWGVLAMIPLFIYNYVLFGSPFFENGHFREDLEWGKLAPYVPPHIYVSAPLYLALGRIPYGQLGDLSILVFMFLPLSVFMLISKSWRNSVLFWITVSALLGNLVMVLLFPTLITAPRYYMASLLLFIPLAAGAAEFVTLTESRPRILTVAIQGSLLIVLLTTLVENTQGGYYDSFYFEKSVLYLEGKLPPCGLQDAWLGQRCRALSIVNQQAQPGDRILSDVLHVYYLRSDLLLCENHDSIKDYMVQSRTSWMPNWNDIYLNGYRFMVVDKYYDQFPNVDNHPAWVEPVNIYSEGDLMVYRLDYYNPPGKPQVSCQETQKGVWGVIR